jgi:hypothetical protein
MVYYYRTKRFFWQTAEKRFDNTAVRHIMKPKAQIHIYCTEEVRAKLEALANLDDRPSMSYTVIKLIEEAHASLFPKKAKAKKG